MIAKRFGAVVLALLLIVGAVALRSTFSGDSPKSTRDTETTSAPDDGSTSTSNSTAPRRPASAVVCTPDLVDACRAAAAKLDSNIAVTVAGVDATLADPAGAPEVWVTLDPLPAAVSVVDPAVAYSTTAVASSPLSLVVSAERADTLTATCGTVVDWKCLGEHAGQRWDQFGGEAAWGTLRPGLSADRTAIGSVSTAAAVRGYFASNSISAADPAFIAWGRQFAGAVSPSTLSAGTAVGTIQVRASTLDVAVGSPAELVQVDDPRFAIVAVGDQASAVVVVAERDGATAPDGFVDAIRSELTSHGWSAESATTSGLAGGDLIAAVSAWEDVSR